MNKGFFKNRKEAGILLSQKLMQYKGKKEEVVLGIPRGGVAVAYEVARNLNIPLDIIVIKKMGFPGQEELAMGAVGLDTFYLNKDIVKNSQITKEYIDTEIKLKQKEAKQRFDFLRGQKSKYSLKDKTIILIDDGIATGATMIMAVQIIKSQSPKKIILAVPVAPKETIEKLQKIVDEVICLNPTSNLMSIGQFYGAFPQVDDSQVKEMLKDD